MGSTYTAHPALDDLYPASPSGVPPDLTAPSPAYTRHARLALLGLFGFVALYLLLTGAFARAAWLLWMDDLADPSEALVPGLLSLAPSFLCLFMLRGLFFTKHSSESVDIEVTEDDEPLLVAFVHRIADEAGAPRPHKIFLSANVNAAVFYDLSFRNLLLPSRKNLVIGLGLVNALTLDELKAVIAHEFGHFAQKTMAVGRYVYVSQQIVGHVVATRGWLDKVLAGLSIIDLRVAWIGWLMRLLVWSVRSVLDTAFRGLLLAQRALSREMEFQADLVSVSLAGSDSLVHGLSRLSAADDAFDRAASFVIGRLHEDKRPADIFAVQTAMLEQMRRIMDDAELGNPPPVPGLDAAAHRVFEDEIAAPPRMWSTHPPNRDREENAKARYVRSPLDPRSAWGVIADPDALRARMTANLIARATATAPPEVLEKIEDETVEETLDAVEAAFDRRPLDRRYRGAYLGRSPVLSARGVGELYDEVDLAGAHTRAAFEDLYPEGLSEQLERYRELREEVATLKALKEGVLEAPGGVIRFRGQEIARAQLVDVIEGTDREVTEAEQALLAHDRAVRTAHRAAARLLGRGWEDHLCGLLALLHYTSHGTAEIDDAMAQLNNVFAVVVADGRVSKSERVRLVNAADDVRAALDNVWAERGEVRLPQPVREAMKVESWGDALPDTFHLGAPTADDIGDWLQTLDPWVSAMRGPLNHAAKETLEVLLAAEEHVQRCVVDGLDPGEAPEPATTPARYTTCCPDQQRELQRKLGLWDRFVLADGWLPGTLRTVVALAVLVPALAFTSSALKPAELTVHNGLSVLTTVTVGDREVVVGSRASERVKLPKTERVSLAAHIDGRLVERFEAAVDRAHRDYVYNVGSAAPMIEWTAVYGGEEEYPPRARGAARFFATSVDYVLRPPPESIETSGPGGTRDVLEALAASPSMMLGWVEDPDEAAAMVRSHATWDRLDEPETAVWMMAAGAVLDDFPEVLAARLAEAPDNMMLLRLQQEAAEGGEVCEEHRARAERAPDDGNAQYLALRCLDDGPAQNEAFAEAAARFPGNPWLAWGSGWGLAEERRWSEARAAMEPLKDGLPEMGELVGLTLARVRRAESPDAVVELDDLAALSVGVGRALAIERADGDGTPLQGWQDLEAGRLPAVLEAVTRVSPDERGLFLWLVATSDGAPGGALRDARLPSASSGLTDATVWAAAALAARDGLELDTYRAIAGEFTEPSDVDALFGLLQTGVLLPQPGAIDALLPSIRPSLRGQAYLMGLRLLGDDAPEEWRTWARLLLLPGERPFIRPPEEQ